MLKKGRVIFIKRVAGYGFIRDTEDKRDFFFPAAELPKGEFENIQIGDMVTFTPTTDHQGRFKAIELQNTKETI